MLRLDLLPFFPHMLPAFSVRCKTNVAGAAQERSRGSRHCDCDRNLRSANAQWLIVRNEAEKSRSIYAPNPQKGHLLASAGFCRGMGMSHFDSHNVGVYKSLYITSRRGDNEEPKTFNAINSTHDTTVVALLYLDRRRTATVPDLLAYLTELKTHPHKDILPVTFLQERIQDCTSLHRLITKANKRTTKAPSHQ